MADFATFAEAEAFAYEGVRAGTFVNAHACRATTGGKFAVRVQKPMSPSAPDAGAWEEITDNGEE